MSTCAVEGCGKRVKGRGYCCGHYQRLMRHGDLRLDQPVTHRRSGSENFNWKGGHVKNGRMFVRVLSHPNADPANGYVLRSRLVMEKQLGRYLTADEIVHHKNGDKSDDRPENLQVMSQSEHAKIHFVRGRFATIHRKAVSA